MATAATAVPVAASGPPEDVVPKRPKDEVDTRLPKLSPAEFRSYNRMADMMEMYHTHFRQTWNQLYAAVSPPSDTKPNMPKMSGPQIIRTGLSLISHLTVHHDIEETHIFPVLATRMPSFREGSFATEQHKLIHAGMDKLQAYLEECRDGERELRRGEVKGVMDGWGDVLWRHLGEEVEELGAESMRRFWSVEEIQRLPM